MTPALLALPNGLFRVQCHLRSLLSPSSITTLRAFSSSLASDGEESPASKALKDIPYPSASPDPSIFEPWSGEYGGVRLPEAVQAQQSVRGSVASRRSANRRIHVTTVLEQLVAKRNFAQAEEVRQDLVKRNVPIRPNKLYSSIIWNILRQRPYPPNRAELFANWMSLIPSLSGKTEPIKISRFRSAILFQSTHLDLDTVVHFGIISSSKGYIRRVGASVVACLTRYADPDVSSRVLDEMIAANEDYNRNGLGTSLNPSTRNVETTRHLWSTAVRTHCTAGRPEVALQTVKRAHERGFRLSQYTYEFLLGKLEAHGLNDLAAEVRAFFHGRSLNVAKSRLVEDRSGLTSIPPVSPLQKEVINQAIVLAILKRSQQSGLPANATDIVPYFDIYKSDLRGGRELNQLRARAYRISPGAASTVFLAELLHHLRRGQFIHVLWVFDKFFDGVGVPSEEVKRRLWKREHYPPHLRLPYGHLPNRITKTTFNLRAKFWPTRYHTALVWIALVHLCETEEELSALYSLLLQYSAQLQKPTVGHHGRSSISTAVSAPVDRFDAAHFRPFLIAFTLLQNDAKNGLRVLDDMQDRGIAPSAQFLGTAAALQARHGEPALALRMLDLTRGLIEPVKEEEIAEAGYVETENEMGVGERDKKQQLLLTAYTGVLRGLIDRRKLVQARQVAELLHSQLGYIEGVGGAGSGNPRTDAALRYLHRLEVEGPDAEPDPTDHYWHGHSRYFYPFLKKPDVEVIKVLTAPPVTNRW